MGWRVRGKNDRGARGWRREEGDGVAGSWGQRDGGGFVFARGGYARGHGGRRKMGPRIREDNGMVGGGKGDGAHSGSRGEALREDNRLRHHRTGQQEDGSPHARGHGGGRGKRGGGGKRDGFLRSRGRLFAGITGGEGRGVGPRIREDTGRGRIRVREGRDGEALGMGWVAGFVFARGKGWVGGFVGTTGWGRMRVRGGGMGCRVREDNGTRAHACSRGGGMGWRGWGRDGRGGFARGRDGLPGSRGHGTGARSCSRGEGWVGGGRDGLAGWRG